MLDAEFWRSTGIDIVACYREHIFDPDGGGKKARDIDGNSFDKYSTEYEESKKTGKLKRQAKKFKDLYTTHVGENFDETFNNASDAWKTGKFYALHFIDALANAGNKQDDLISQVVRYGMSGVKGVSSSFIKSGN